MREHQKRNLRREDMEKAYKLSFETEQNEGLVVTNCGFSKTEPMHIIPQI